MGKITLIDRIGFDNRVVIDTSNEGVDSVTINGKRRVFLEKGGLINAIVDHLNQRRGSTNRTNAHRMKKIELNYPGDEEAIKIDEILGRAFDENRGQWYKIPELDSDDKKKLGRFIERYIHHKKITVKLYDEYNTENFYIFTDHMKLMDKIREKHFLTVVDINEEDFLNEDVYHEKSIKPHEKELQNPKIKKVKELSKSLENQINQVIEKFEKENKVTFLSIESGGDQNRKVSLAVDYKNL